MGRRIPTEKNRNPQLYRMRIFAPDDVQASSKFWYYMNRLKKLKKTRGEIVFIGQVGNLLLKLSKPFSVLRVIVPQSRNFYW